MSHPGIRRLRMFAGPNGSGKTILADTLARRGIFSPHHFINADDLFRKLRGSGIRFDTFGLTVTWPKLRESLIKAGRLRADHPFLANVWMQDSDSRLTAPANVCDAYVAASI